MLDSNTPFPQAGSYGLFQAAGTTELARIMSRPPATEGAEPFAEISLPLVYGASGNKRVPLADVLDGTPLTKGEEAEYRRLDRELAGQSRPNRTKHARLQQLRLRSIRAPMLKDLLDRLAAAHAARRVA